MNKFFTFAVIATAFMTSACAYEAPSRDYDYETQAPYSMERTARAETTTVTTAPAQDTGMIMDTIEDTDPNTSGDMMTQESEPRVVQNDPITSPGDRMFSDSQRK